MEAVADGLFQRALAFASRWEGGFSDHPADDGGRTMAGVTEATWRAWLAKKGLPRRPVESSTPAEREQLYFEEYWQPAGCFNFGPHLAVPLFDAAVNLGVARAVCLVQAIVGAAVDGRLGPKTRAAVADYSEVRAARDLVAARRGYYVARVFADGGNWTFLRGWLNRCDDLLRELGMVGA